MTRQSLQAFRRRVTVDWPKGQEAEARAHLLRTARAGNAEILAEQTRRSGIAPSVEAYANTPGNHNLETVRLPGPIVFNYDYRREIIIAALDALRAASPVESGLYRDSHTLFINGQAATIIPAMIIDTDDVMIANPVPYARRLEVGKTKSGRAFILKAEPHIYERVAKRVLMPRYRHVARISFSYASLPNAHVVKGGLSSHYGTGATPGPRGGGTTRKRDQKPGSQVRSPAIVIGALI